MENISQDILEEMRKDMEDDGVSQRDITLLLNHWKEKYIIVRKNGDIKK